MKTIKTLLLFLVLISIPATIISCEEEETTTVSEDDCLDELTALSDLLVDASNAFSTNITSSNCSAVKAAALNLINAAEDCGYGYMYEEQTTFWVNYDCSEFD